jgi:hypothetical protein
MQSSLKAPVQIADEALEQITGGGQLIDHTVTEIRGSGSEGARGTRKPAELVTFFGQLLDHTVT